jgi:hypothetical protein
MTEVTSGSALGEDSPSVQTHLGFLQGTIERMAGNSTSAKTWCIALVSAILVVTADKSKPDYALLALIPALLFTALDVYYLAMEKGFRNAYDGFARKLHAGDLAADDLYSVRPVGKNGKLRVEALRSFSVWGFYLGIILMIGLARGLILR